MKTARTLATAFILAASGVAFAAGSQSAENKPGGHTDAEVAHPVSPLPPELEKPPASQPFLLGLLIHPMRRGMCVRLPVIDTDPNRGITFGIMPVWIVNSPYEDRIVHIHAPSVTYNRWLKTNFTYRYFYYPTKDSSLTFRASDAEVNDHEVFAEYEGFSFMNGDARASLMLQYNVDGSNRFYGIGPRTPRSAQSNYTDDILQYTARFGFSASRLIPKLHDWQATLSHHMSGERIQNGPVESLPDINQTFPGISPEHRHQNAALRATLSHDSRDNTITTSKGVLAEFFAENSARALGSEYRYQRYGADLRRFYKSENHDRFVTAARIKFEQLIGDSLHFWLFPQLGGKYSQRAYGDGRFTDRGMMTTGVEERITAYKLKTAGVTTEFEVAPFAGLGEVFPTVTRATERYLRPVAGVAFRAVARPQVVGSIDFGVGQEGLAAFMDINYSY